MAVAETPPSPTETTAAAAIFRQGYIIGPVADGVWFLGLPFVAIAIGLASQQWLPAVAVASVALWVTVPHHFATWLRAYGLREDWARFKDRLIVGPLVICGLTLVGLQWAPLTFLLLTWAWDHQHSVMQQHGLARIYDFKAHAGSPLTPRFDLTLNLVLYVNLLITAPIFADFWIRELHRFALPISASGVRILQSVSWTITGLFLVVYVVHLVRGVRAGYPLNPLKYGFLGASYFLWYFVAWQSHSLLVQQIAHALMHGVQYIVIVYVYVARKAGAAADSQRLLSRLMQPRNIWAFLLLCVGYALIYQLITAQSLDVFGFGVVSFTGEYAALPEHGLDAMSRESGYDLFAAMLIQSVALVHYFFDSFIWKVRDVNVQGGL